MMARAPVETTSLCDIHLVLTKMQFILSRVCSRFCSLAVKQPRFSRYRAQILCRGKTRANLILVKIRSRSSSHEMYNLFMGRLQISQQYSRKLWPWVPGCLHPRSKLTLKKLLKKPQWASCHLSELYNTRQHHSDYIKFSKITHGTNMS